MAIIQTLPDILLHLFAYPSITVSDLLKCELVCRQWHTLIHQYQVLIWRAKLVEGFPKECLPVLHGEEVWRDIAILWWAWKSLGSVDELVDLDGSSEVRDSQMLMRKSDGVIRDLTTANSATSNGHWFYALQPNGLVYVKVGEETRTDTVFTDNIPIPSTLQLKAATSMKYIRPKILELDNPISISMVYRNLDSGKVGVMPDPSPWYYSRTICGSRLKIEYGTDTDGDSAILKVFSTDDRSKDFQTTVRKPSHSMLNESILACLHRSYSYGALLLLVSIKDGTQLASYTFHDTVPEQAQITRFTVIADCSTNPSWVENEFWIFDLKLNLLCKLGIPLLAAERKFNFFEARAEDWMLCLVGGAHYAVLDPFIRRFRLLGVPASAVDPVRGVQGGYHFSTIEYPVDKKGKRTGARGLNRYYWRWLGR
ncbi:hypothetical protein HDV00_003667 [Rhizophlyctis rosea]|nr:hypothetical protein HDV00_003667 [Rhizophlyctis rosea]